MPLLNMKPAMKPVC